jgi:hypothetical protein
MNSITPLRSFSTVVVMDGTTVSAIVSEVANAAMVPISNGRKIMYLGEKAGCECQVDTHRPSTIQLQLTHFSLGYNDSTVSIDCCVSAARAVALTASMLKPARSSSAAWTCQTDKFPVTFV